ncbi:hypothetical protein [Yinghuangia seranimata]|uniref:hypothetical protein n=1 Tax=Yinghuangia seranimata TaxID=408067 RepID=UPI00248D0492|nr:hypothetical protein [Yinghuangia seranimata]MDI2127279.1 hypothetical protein [Yinghuangia seranimata]MDI2132224.1 hypothetical protein [Yinghuangia seranimata]
MTPAEVEAEIKGLNVSEDVKQRLREGLAVAVNAINNPATPQKDKNSFMYIVDSINQALKLIQDPTTSQADRAMYLKYVQGINEATRLTQDANLSATDRAVYLQLASALASYTTNLQDPGLPAVYKGLYIKIADSITNGLLAAVDPKTAPKKPEDQQKVKQILQDTNTTAAAALAVLQDPNATPEAKQQAQQQVQAIVDARTNAVQNNDYLRFLNEVKRYNPSDACLQAIADRTTQAGWPDGSLWGLTDPSCADALTRALADNDTKWKSLYMCVQNQPFSTCAVYIPPEG